MMKTFALDDSQAGLGLAVSPNAYVGPNEC